MHALYWWLAFLILTAPGTAPAHDLQYQVTEQSALTIRIFYADNRPFSFENYELYREGEKIPFQVGRSDQEGRIVFLPEGQGNWHIKTYSEDGHGLSFSFNTDAESELSHVEKPLFERYSRLFVGLGLILGLFGLASLFLSRKSRHN